MKSGPPEGIYSSLYFWCLMPTRATLGPATRPWLGTALGSSDALLGLVDLTIQSPLFIYHACLDFLTSDCPGTTVHTSLLLRSLAKEKAVVVRVPSVPRAVHGDTPGMCLLDVLVKQHTAVAPTGRREGQRVMLFRL